MLAVVEFISQLVILCIQVIQFCHKEKKKPVYAQKITSNAVHQDSYVARLS